MLMISRHWNSKHTGCFENSIRDILGLLSRCDIPFFLFGWVLLILLVDLLWLIQNVCLASRPQTDHIHISEEIWIFDWSFYWCKKDHQGHFCMSLNSLLFVFQIPSALLSTMIYPTAPLASIGLWPENQLEVAHRWKVCKISKPQPPAAEQWPQGRSKNNQVCLIDQRHWGLLLQQTKSSKRVFSSTKRSTSRHR